MAMDEKALEAQRAYKREWRKKNIDKVKEHEARYWAKKAAQTETPEEAANLKEKMLEAQREYKREWRKKNKDKIKEQNARYWAKKAAQMTAQGKADSPA